MNSELDLKSTLSKRRIVGMWRMLTGYRAIFVGAFLSVGLAAVCQTVFYYLLAYFVDDVLGVEAMRGMLPWVAAGFLGLAVAQGTFTFMGGRWAAKTSESVIRRLRDYLYDHVQRLTFTYHDKTPTGDLIQKQGDNLRQVLAIPVHIDGATHQGGRGHIQIAPQRQKDVANQNRVTQAASLRTSPSCDRSPRTRRWTSCRCGTAIRWRTPRASYITITASATAIANKPLSSPYW